MSMQATITAKYPSTCSCCRQPIPAGSKIEWSKGKHPHATPLALPAPLRLLRLRREDATGMPRPSPATALLGGAYRKACVSDGNCSSMGSGRSCGGHDCDGY